MEAGEFEPPSLFGLQAHASDARALQRSVRGVSREADCEVTCALCCVPSLSLGQAQRRQLPNHSLLPNHRLLPESGEVWTMKHEGCGEGRGETRRNSRGV